MTKDINPTRRACLAGLVAAGGASFLPRPLQAAEGFPSGPVEYLIPFSPGGGMDQTARLIGPRMETLLGQPILPINKPGASGFIATQFMNTKPADGYTVIQHSLGSLCLTSMLAPQPVDPRTGMRYLGQVALLNAGLAVRADSPWMTLDDLVEDMKARPTQLSWGHAGKGGFTHVNGVALMAATGTEAQDIPFKGSSPNMTALVGGHIDMAILNTSNSVGFGDQIRFLTVFARKRDSLVPDVPTIREAGYDMTPVESPAVIAVRPETPEETVAVLKEAIRSAALQEGYRADLVKIGLIPDYAGEEDILAFIDASFPAWQSTVDLVKANG